MTVLKEDPVGRVTRLRIDQHGKNVVLNGVIKQDSGIAVAFAMRGSEVRGILEVGDRARLQPESKQQTGGAVSTKHVQNLTTSSLVSVWTPPLRARVREMAAPVLLSAILGQLIGAIAAILLKSGNAPTLTLHSVGGGGGDRELPTFSAPFDHGSSSTSPSVVTFVIIGGVILALIAIPICMLHARQRRQTAQAELIRAAEARRPGPSSRGVALPRGGANRQGPNRLLIQLQDLRNLGDRQELVHDPQGYPIGHERG